MSDSTASNERPKAEYERLLDACRHLAAFLPNGTEPPGQDRILDLYQMQEILAWRTELARHIDAPGRNTRTAKGGE